MASEGDGNFFSKYQSLWVKAANRRNLLYTSLIFFNHFAYGLCAVVIMAPLLDLSFIYGVNLNTISYLTFPLGVGYLTGSFASELTRFIPRQLLVGASALLFGLTTLALPFYGRLWALWTGAALLGVGSGVWDSSQSVLLVEMWPSWAANAVLQTTQGCYGLGTIVAPFLVSPFVFGEKNSTIGVDGRNETITPEMRERALAVPYVVSGLTASAVPLLFLVLYFVFPHKKATAITTTNTSSEDAGKEEDDQQKQEQPHRKLLIGLIGLCAASYMTGEISYLSYSTTMWQVVVEGPMAAPEANHLMAILTASYTAGRLLTAVISLRVNRPEMILAYHFALTITSLVLLFFGRSTTFRTLVSALLGYGFSACWPSMFAFTEQNLRLTGRVASLYSFLVGVIGLAVPLVLGQTFAAHPKVLLVLVTGFVLLGVGFFAAAWLVIRFGGGGNRSSRRSRK